MATKAVSVVVERAPGGGSGWSLRVGGAERFLFGTDFKALAWISCKMREQGADIRERGRVLRLVIGEMARIKRVEVVAEVAL